MTIIEKLKKEIELYDGQNWQEILDDFSNLDSDALSEIALTDLEKLIYRYQFEEHYLNIKLDSWGIFLPSYRNNTMWSIFNTTGCYINFILYLNSPQKWCSWLSYFCDYVKVSFIQCLLERPTIHVDYSALLELAFEQEDHLLARFLIYAYICAGVILDDALISCLAKHRENVISIILPVLCDIFLPEKFKHTIDLQERLIQLLRAQYVISSVRGIIETKIRTNELKGEFRLWAKCLSMTSCARPDQEFSELYCQWLENLLHNVNFTYNFITSESRFQNLELLYTNLISNCLNEQAIDHVKSVFVKSFSPYGGWNDPNKAWKRDYLFQHTGLILAVFGMKETIDDKLISFVLNQIYKAIPFVLNKSEYDLLLLYIINFPWNESHASLGTLIRIVHCIDSLEYLEQLKKQYLISGGESTALLNAFDAQRDLLVAFNQV